MARKTFVDLSDTLNAFRVKTNVISYNVGDLDSLHSSLPDSDLVQAINSLRSSDSNNFVNLQAQITSNDSDVINLQSQITTNDSDINHLQLQIASNNDSLASERLARIAGDNNLQTQITNNDSDILALQNITGGGGSTSLQTQITNNDSDILSLQAQITGNDSDIANITVVRTSTFSILKSDGTVAKRIFGFVDSGV